MKEKFTDWKPTGKSALLLSWIADILDEYREQGYALTLRQLYYQLVSRDVIANRVQEYKRIGNIVNRARLSGHIDWSMIEDRVRVPAINSHWDSPAAILKSAANSFYMPKWEGQRYYIEVWCEKDAVSNIIEPVCRRWDVVFMANRGYSSQSAMHEGFQRLVQSNRVACILYLGDHDPSGIDMTNDIKKRMGTFLYGDTDVSFENVRRLALNMDQVRQYRPPENPAKITDSRYEKYAQVYGTSSWELDALEPAVLSELVETAIFEFLDHGKFTQIEERETEYKKNLMQIASNYKG